MPAARLPLENSLIPNPKLIIAPNTGIFLAAALPPIFKTFPILNNILPFAPPVRKSFASPINCKKFPTPLIIPVNAFKLVNVFILPKIFNASRNSGGIFFPANIPNPSIPNPATKPNIWRKIVLRSPDFGLIFSSESSDSWGIIRSLILPMIPVTPFTFSVSPRKDFCILKKTDANIVATSLVRFLSEPVNDDLILSFSEGIAEPPVDDGLTSLRNNLSFPVNSSLTPFSASIISKNSINRLASPTIVL